MFKDHYNYKYREIISEILFDVWDPIGIQNFTDSKEEYTAYVAHIIYLIRNNQTLSEIAAFLSVVEQNMLLEPRESFNIEVAQFIQDSLKKGCVDRRKKELLKGWI